MEMFDIIHSILDFLGLFWTYAIEIGREMLFVVELLGTFFVHIPAYFSWLPGSLVSVLITLISIVIVYKVLGREG